MSPYRYDLFSEMFGWVADYPQSGLVGLCIASCLVLVVVLYELGQYLVKRRGVNRAD